MNILLSSVGRRNYLVDYFKDALAGHGKVIAVNSIENTSGMLAADESVLLPSAKSPKFIDELLAVCKVYEVKLLFSLHDWEIPLIAEQESRFKEIGVELVMPGVDFIDICLDKLKTYKFCLENGIRTITTYSQVSECLDDLGKGFVNYPFILKPRWGQGSLAMQIVHNDEELTNSYNELRQNLKKISGFYNSDQEDSIIIQEFINATEYGVDIINNLKGEHHCNFIKKKIAMRAGETDAAVTNFQNEIDDLGKKIGLLSNHKGVIDADFLLRDEKAYLLELNPRFGGGYPFSHIAGVDIPKAIIEWKKGHSDVSKYCNLKENIIGSKGIKMYSKEL